MAASMPQRKAGQAGRCLTLHSPCAAPQLPLPQLSDCQEVGGQVEAGDLRCRPLCCQPSRGHPHRAANVDDVVCLPQVVCFLERVDLLEYGFAQPGLQHKRRKRCVSAALVDRQCSCNQWRMAGSGAADAHSCSPAAHRFRRRPRCAHPAPLLRVHWTVQRWQHTARRRPDAACAPEPAAASAPLCATPAVPSPRWLAPPQMLPASSGCLRRILMMSIDRGEAKSTKDAQSDAGTG